MDFEQCVEMMEHLRDSYKQMSSSNNISISDIRKVKHILTQLELSMISIRNSVDKMTKPKTTPPPHPPPSK